MRPCQRYPLNIALLMCLGEGHVDAELALCSVQSHAKYAEGVCRAIGEWVATLGKKLFTGGGLGSTPAPVAIFEPRSNLQKLTDCWVYTSLLQRAAAAPDSVTRLQYTAAWFVAGLRHAFDTWCKPFNPVLGETWQSATSSGCEAFLEQVSHHPPVAAFALEGEGFRLHGSAELQISVRMLSRRTGPQSCRVHVSMKTDGLPGPD